MAARVDMLKEDRVYMDRTTDLICQHNLGSLPLPNKLQLTNYLNYYKKRLIPYLNRDSSVSREDVENFEANFGTVVEFLVGCLEKGRLRLYVGRRTYLRDLDGLLVFGPWKDGLDQPPYILYFAHGLKSESFESGLHFPPPTELFSEFESDPSTSNKAKKKNRKRKN